MYVSRMSIEEFLETTLDSLKAPIWKDYDAFVFPIARTADGKELQDEINDSWDSLDNLTNDRILVIMPCLSDQHKKAIVSMPYAEYGVCGNLSILGGQQSSIWESALKKVDPESRKCLASVRREALTKVATETARFFGIPEQ